MSEALLYFIGVIMPYVSIGLFIGGLLFRLVNWLTVPVPVRLPVTPAPITRLGVVGRMGVEFISFRSLLKSNKSLWLGGYLFHVLLGITFLVHLLNLYLYYDVKYIVDSLWFDKLATFSGILFGFSLAYLLFRRILIESIRYVSKLPDYLILVLLLLLIFFGNYTRAYGGIDLDAVRSYMLSLLYFKPTLPPDNIYFLTHYVLAMIFLIYVPFSKIGHLIGWLLAPSRNMRNIARHKRHINPWNEEVPGRPMSWEEYYQKFKHELEQLGPGGERK